MELSELQKILIGGLKVCGAKLDDIVAIMLLLKTEDEQWEMADYIDAIIENPPSIATIFAKAVRISQTKTYDFPQ